MGLSDAGIILIWIAMVAAFGLASWAINAMWRRILGAPMGFGHWASSLLTMPFILMLFGLYRLFEPDPCADYPFGFWCDPEAMRMDGGFGFILLFPLISFCCAIPVTMWFTTKYSEK